MVGGSIVRMPRHTSFRFRLDPSVEQERVLSQHVGAARFAFNQSLRLHKDARASATRAPGSAYNAMPGLRPTATAGGRRRCWWCSGAVVGV